VEIYLCYRPFVVRCQFNVETSRHRPTCILYIKFRDSFMNFFMSINHFFSCNSLPIFLNQAVKLYVQQMNY